MNPSLCEDGKSALTSMAERGAPVSDELEERDSVVLAEMVRNLQIGMIGMEQEVQRRRSVFPARKTNAEDATPAKGTGDMAGRPRDAIWRRMRGRLVVSRAALTNSMQVEMWGST